MTIGPHPLAGLDRGLHQEPFGGEAAAWRQPHERQSAEAEREERHRHRARGAAEVGDAIMAKGLGDEACGEEHRRLGEGVRQGLHDSAAEGVRRPRPSREREHQEQVADLRHRRIGDEQFQPRLTQSQHAAEQDRSRTERGEDRPWDHARKSRQHVEPEPDNEEERSLHHQPRQHRACGGGRVGVGGGQPQMQGEKRGLRQEACGHQPGRQPHGRLGANKRRKERDVERAIGSVEQGDAEQIEHRAEQREQEIAQRGGHRLRTSVERNQRNRGEGEKLEPDIEIEQIAAQKDEAQRRLDALQQSPEDERRALLRQFLRRREIGPGVERGGRRDQSRRHEHDGGKSIGSERDAERRRITGERVDERLSRAPDETCDRDGDSEFDRHEAERNPFRPPPADEKRQQHAESGQEDRQRQQASARRRRDRGGASRHSAPAPPSGGLAQASGFNVAWPVSSNSRNTRATASALAAKATTIPVMTIACGTGSACNPAAAPFPRDDAEHEENAAAHQIEREDFPQRLGIGDEAIEAKADQRRPDKPSQRRRGHRRGSRRGGPATSMGSVTAMERTMNASMNRIAGLANPGG